MKPCKKCGQVSEGPCKPCRNARAKAWAAANPEKRAAANAKYHAANKEGVRVVNNAWKERNRDSYEAKKAEYLEKNKNAIQVKRAEYHVQNRELINARSRQWQLDNPEKCRVHAQRRRAKVKNAQGSLSIDICERLMRLQMGKCPVCRLSLGENYDLDHIVPLARGGSNDDTNVQLLHSKCNREKSAKDPVAFMQARGFLL